jgi:hypothetical protein
VSNANVFNNFIQLILYHGSSAESIISSIYFSTYSISKESQINCKLDEMEEDEEDLTMMAEPTNKRNKIGRKIMRKNEERLSSESEEEETIRANIIELI